MIYLVSTLLSCLANTSYFITTRGVCPTNSLLQVVLLCSPSLLIFTTFISSVSFLSLSFPTDYSPSLCFPIHFLPFAYSRGSESALSFPSLFTCHQAVTVRTVLSHLVPVNSWRSPSPGHQGFWCIFKTLKTFL